MDFTNIYICISLIVAFATTLLYNHLIHNYEEAYEELEENNKNLGGRLDLKSYKLLPVLFLVVFIFWIPLLFGNLIEKIIKRSK